MCLAGEKSLCPRFAIFGEHSDGTDRERLVVPAANLVRVPDGFPIEAAAAAPLVTLTAWRMIATRGRVRPGEDVLILGAGAGVGVMCIQIAKLCGARVIAAASTADKLERCRALGADVLLDYTKGDFDREIRALTAKRGVDVVVDYLGKETWVRSLRSLRRGGRLVTCGATTGHDPVEDVRYLYFNQLEVIGCTMGNAKEFRDAMAAVFAGRVKPVVDRVMPLRDAADAHRAIERREVFGKIVMVP
jgi:NADPH:quinone reductase-like Zn-dependent oxidoreductase